MMTRMLCLSVMVAIAGPAIAMVPARDEEMQAIRGGGCNERCEQYGGDEDCDYPDHTCIQDIRWYNGFPIPIGCQNPGYTCDDNVVWGPSHDDICVEAQGPGCDLRHDGLCQQAQHGTCAGILFCTCDNPGPAVWEGTRDWCM